MISYRSTGETTRLTSYSVQNSVLDASGSSTIRPYTVKRGTSVSSRLLEVNANEEQNAISFASFKVLPIDPARARRTTGSFEETADDLSWAKSCKEAVEIIVDTIYQAVKDIGGENGEKFIIDAPIVSLLEAQRATTVIAKMEYGLKRLLWLGS